MDLRAHDLIEGGELEVDVSTARARRMQRQRSPDTNGRPTTRLGTREILGWVVGDVGELIPRESGPHLVQ